MPQHRGSKLTRRSNLSELQVTSTGGGTPAIALTAYARVEDQLRALWASYQMFARKPIEVSELCRLIADLSIDNASSASNNKILKCQVNLRPSRNLIIDRVVFVDLQMHMIGIIVRRLLNDDVVVL
jgi:CheY-like chemotaxis protein